MLRVYVAGRTNDIHRIRQIQYICRQVGWTITYDWTENVEAQLARPEKDPELLAEYAANDIQGVWNADLVIVMCSPALLGTAIEMGAAIILGRRVWLVGEPERDSVFFYLPNFERIKDELTLFDRITAEARKLEIGRAHV